MAFMKWQETYELGIKEFDDHHKHLVHLLNTTYDSLKSGADISALGSVLDELIDYATYHFAAEEQWMIAHKYHKLSRHRDEHNAFSSKVTEFQKLFHQGKADLSTEVLTFLLDWLTDHIIVSDADYGHFAARFPHPDDAA